MNLAEDLRLNALFLTSTVRRNEFPLLVIVYFVLHSYRYIEGILTHYEWFRNNLTVEEAYRKPESAQTF